MPNVLVATDSGIRWLNEPEPARDLPPASAPEPLPQHLLLVGKFPDAVALQHRRRWREHAGKDRRELIRCLARGVGERDAERSRKHREHDSLSSSSKESRAHPASSSLLRPHRALASITQAPRAGRRVPSASVRRGDRADGVPRPAKPARQTYRNLSRRVPL
jgi:hypothetical protein